MKTIGIFDAKITLSAICERPMTISERRADYMVEFGASEVQYAAEFEVPERSREMLECP